MTNGEKIKAMFPSMIVGFITESQVGIYFVENQHSATVFNLDWWNAEYVEPVIDENGISNKSIIYKAKESKEIQEDLDKLNKLNEPTTKDNSAVEEHKGEVMYFPDTFDEFAEDYGFKDKEEVYTNGSELIQVYRVKQWLEHINEITTMIDKSNFSQEQYKTDLQSAYDCGYAQAKNDSGVDCISRKELDKALYERFHEEDSPNNMTDVRLGAVRNFIKNFPSVIPQISSELDKNSKKLEKYFGESDCIDRAELLKAMDTQDKFGNDPNEGPIPLRTPALQDRYVPYVKYDDMVNCVKGMPSAALIRPKGHWILGGYDDDYYICDKCNYTASEYYHKPRYNFCPNCGANMREVEE